MLIPLPECLRGIVHFNNGLLIFDEGVIPSAEQESSLRAYNQKMQTETIIED